MVNEIGALPSTQKSAQLKGNLKDERKGKKIYKILLVNGWQQKTNLAIYVFQLWR